MVDVRSEINFCDSIAAMALVRSEPILTDAADCSKVRNVRSKGASSEGDFRLDFASHVRLVDKETLEKMGGQNHAV